MVHVSGVGTVMDLKVASGGMVSCSGLIRSVHLHAGVNRVQHRPKRPWKVPAWSASSARPTLPKTNPPGHRRARISSQLPREAAQVVHPQPNGKAHSFEERLLTP